MKKLNRRQLIIGSCIAVLLGGGAIVGGYELKSAVVSIVRRRLGQTSIAAEDLDRFVADLTENRQDLLNSTRAKMVIRGRAFFLNGAFRWLMSKNMRHKLDSFEGHILTPLLLGSNFFESEAPPERLEYRQFPDPWALGCANPLARFDFD